MSFAVPVWLAVVLALAPASRESASTRSASEEFPDADRAALTAIIEKGMADKRLPGLNVGIWIPGRGNLVQSFGTGDLETGAPMEIADHVRIASVTKTFTATAILQLVDQGKLSLDDTLASFIDGIPNGDRITIRHLLSMTSGIYDFPADQQFMKDITADPLMAFGADDVIAILRRNQPNFEPGAEVVYCDTNYILLGVILEKVSGRKAADIIAEDFIAPLKLDGDELPGHTGDARALRPRLLCRRRRQGPVRGLHPLEPQLALDRGRDDLDARRPPRLGEGAGDRDGAQPGDPARAAHLPALHHRQRGRQLRPRHPQLLRLPRPLRHDLRLYDRDLLPAGSRRDVRDLGQPVDQFLDGGDRDLPQARRHLYPDRFE